jgi:GxxExxY protein
MEDVIDKKTEQKVYSKKVIYPELSYLVNGILFGVKKELGQYAREKQYGDLIEKKLKEKNIGYDREIAIGNTGNIIDFLIDNKIVLELKAARFIVSDNYRQIQNYLQHAKVKLGILANFREKFMKPVRIVRIDSEQFS